MNYLVQSESFSRSVKRFEFESLSSAISFADMRQKSCKRSVNVWEKVQSFSDYDLYRNVYNTQGFDFGTMILFH